MNVEEAIKNCEIYFSPDTASLQMLHPQEQSALQMQAPCISQSHL